MKKGRWLKNSLHLFTKGELSFSDIYNVILARYAAKPTSFRLRGILFSHVDHVFWSAIVDIFINDVYEIRRLNLKAKHTIIDIGAHRGGFTAYVASTLKATVIAYEPHPENYRYLLKVIDTNHLQNVATYEKAIGGESKKGLLLVSPTSSRHRISDIDTQQSLLETVEILSLDDALRNIETVHLLKMDCEGAEIDVLLNTGEATMSKIKAIATETHFPITDPKMQQLKSRLSHFFSTVKYIDQEQNDLGFIYAWN